MIPSIVYTELGFSGKSSIISNTSSFYPVPWFFHSCLAHHVFEKWWLLFIFRRLLDVYQRVPLERDFPGKSSIISSTFSFYRVPCPHCVWEMMTSFRFSSSARCVSVNSLTTWFSRKFFWNLVSLWLIYYSWLAHVLKKNSLKLVSYFWSCPAAARCTQTSATRRRQPARLWWWVSLRGSLSSREAR